MKNAQLKLVNSLTHHAETITLVIGDKSDYTKDGLVVVGNWMAISVDVVLGIGDIWNTPFKQLVVATSDGCNVAMALFQYLKGGEQYVWT